MKMLLEKTKFLICNDVSKDKTVLMTGENELFDNDISRYVRTEHIVFNIKNIKLRSKYRKAFSKTKNACFLNGEPLEIVANQNFDVVVLQNDWQKLLQDAAIVENSKILMIVYESLTIQDIELIDSIVGQYKYVINYVCEKDKDICTLSQHNILAFESGILLLSNEKTNVKESYVVFDNNIKKELEKARVDIQSQRNATNYFAGELYRTQKNTYLIFGPLRVLKRKILHSFLFELAKKIKQIIKKEGIKGVFDRLLKRCGLKAKEHSYAHLFVNKNEYVDMDSEYQDNIDFSDNSTDVKMLAYYLPQFHCFKENDEWWGKGFTEWSNTKVATPRFDGHYQPRTPHKDIGYYDLSNIETLKKQVALAKQHGIYGFCFYYYWFSGKRLMEKPVDMLLEHKEIDMPFCLCWANENWTRAWDGQNKSVLIAQDYSDQDDERFMVDMKKYIDDERYIRINGKPLVVVYNPGQIPDCNKSFEKWREVARKIGIGEIVIWTCRTANNTAHTLDIESCIDAEIEFPPHNTWLTDFAIKDKDLGGESAYLFNYQKMVDAILYDYKNGDDLKTGSKPVHHACMMAWDNAARRKKDWFTYHNFSLKSLYEWVLTICEQARRDFDKEERFVFINAWNEWAEGTYLEPDEKYGYANINTVSKALMGLPLEDNITVLNKTDAELKPEDFDKKIAVQIHMFYTETLDETIENINHIPYKFDCYVSTDTQEKSDYIKDKLAHECKCEKAVVELFENKGRDVAPFILQMADRIDEYDYICHIHSKRTVTGDHGNDWREYIFKHLFGSEDYLRKVFNVFEKEQDVGIMFPETFPPLENQAEWGGNLQTCKSLMDKLDVECEWPQNPVFPVGNMFWAKTEAVREMFLHFKSKDFPKEEKQVNATIMHGIERCWVFLAKAYGYEYRKVFNNVTSSANKKNKKRIAFYVHYNKENLVDESDIRSLKEYSKSFDEIILVSNSQISDKDKKHISEIVSKIIVRENKNFDFGAWKDALEQYGYDNLLRFDQVVLINNSTFAPLYDIENAFSKMEQEKCDFWGLTLFPKIKGDSYLNKKVIAEHIQSFFVVFEKSIIENNDIKAFFDTFEGADDFKDAVANGEVALTAFLRKKGYKYAPYITESYYWCNYLADYSIPYTKPATLAMLENPLIKKKAYQYMTASERIKLEQFVSKLNKSEVLK